MIPAPRRTVSRPATSKWADLEDDDDEGWQVVRSDDNPFGLDEEDQKRYHYKPPDRLDSTAAGPSTVSNATGAHIELDHDTPMTDSWREKVTQDESDYTRLRLDEDEESEEVHMRTRYLFDEDKAMTPLSQMQATKEILTEGQRIAYVGLCHLVARRLVRDTGRGWEGLKVKGKGKNREQPMVESAQIWMLKIMARLYQHMELERDEQRMIESLGEHGVDASDLVPALMTTHTVKNPEFDPAAKKRAEAEAEQRALEEEDEEDVSDTETEAPPPYQARPPPLLSTSPARSRQSPVNHVESPQKSINPFGEDEDDDQPIASSSRSVHHVGQRLPSLEDEEDEGDIGVSASTETKRSAILEDDEGDIGSAGSTAEVETEESKDMARTPGLTDTPTVVVPEGDLEKTPQQDPKPLPEEKEGQEDIPPALPSLPGVSTTLTSADEVVTLDIRWTVLCDLFLVLIADSVYDARSRVFLEKVAEALGFHWLDVVRFENRVTETLEISENMEKTEQGEIIEGRRKGARRKRIAMMGAAAVGGALVIGLSAGLMAPLIGAGLGAAFTTVGISGTTAFLAGTGGAAVITTTGVLTGANIAGRGMARRTREVRTFELRPLHNNQRVSCYITVGGFMSGKYDDVRLPFSVLDPIVGDVVSVFWEPEMMHEMGSAIRILSSEILTQVGQQVLAATVMTALMSALQWPMILTKLGYLIDNPWSNALDRSRAAGLVLADTIIQRHAGVRPISLIGFSLGARTIFYALIELARLKAYGLVQDVFIFGTTVTASRQTWLDVRSVVAGRFVNGFASNDWMLGYLFRATSGGLNTVAGLRAVDNVPGLENIDMTDVISGHMSYRSCMPQLLDKVGFPVTALYFDEPEDPDVDMSVQERRIVNEAEEQAKNKKKILGIFPRREGRSSGSGANTPSERKASQEQKRVDDDEDLPPREEADLGSMAPSTVDQDLDPKAREEAERERKAMEEAKRAEEKALSAIPKTAGFDFSAISKELGKEIDLEKLHEPEPRPEPRVPQSSTTVQPPLERSGSAPPNVNSEASTLAAPLRHNRWAAEEDDEGDITFATNQARQLSINDTPSWDRSEMSAPSWDRPALKTASSGSSSGSTERAPFSPPPSAKQPFSFGFNAWAPPEPVAAPAGAGMRNAPPARPHPAELMANPFASSSVPSLAEKGGGFGSIWKKEEDMATNNPW